MAPSSSYYGGSGGGGGGNFSTAYYPTSSFDSGSSINEKELKKQQTEAQKRKQKEMREWTLSKLPEWRKLKIMKITKQLLKQYYFEKGVKHMATGMKWFLIFLGFAIFLNFSRILDLIKMIIK